MKYLKGRKADITMCIDDHIRYSEENLKNQLEEFFNRKYPAGNLVSHGLDHHRRVWEFAKELLHYTSFETDQQFVSSLMIACYLHDIGMAVDAGKRHGLQGRKYCEEFLAETGICPADNTDLLEAVENHDNKEYNRPAGTNRILNILSAADDLDAFGEEGIARYLEIYRLRGISENDISESITGNAQKRFGNFERLFSGHPHLVSRHKERYNRLVDHFRRLK